MAIVGVGVGLAGLMLAGNQRINSRMDRLEDAIRDLSNRVARLEGAFPYLNLQKPE